MTRDEALSAIENKNIIYERIWVEDFNDHARIFMIPTEIEGDEIVGRHYVYTQEQKKINLENAKFYTAYDELMDALGHNWVDRGAINIINLYRVELDRIKPDSSRYSKGLSAPQGASR